MRWQILNMLFFGIKRMAISHSFNPDFFFHICLDYSFLNQVLQPLNPQHLFIKLSFRKIQLPHGLTVFCETKRNIYLSYTAALVNPSTSQSKPKHLFIRFPFRKIQVPQGLTVLCETKHLLTIN